MTDQQHNDLERRLFDAAPQQQAEPNVQDWLSRHEADVELLQRQGLNSDRSLHRSAWQRLQMAAVIALLLGLGFLAGRVSSLHHSLESMQVQWDKDLQHNSETLRAEILQQLHQDIESLTQQTLAASKKATDQRLHKLISLIEEVRQRDRSQVVAALEQIQRERDRDRLQFSNSLQALAARPLESETYRTR